jgi:lysozyme
MNNVKDLIQKHEGLRLQPYTDTTGNITIGYGHNCTANPLDPSLYEPDGSISQATADEVFDDDLAAATLALVTNWTPHFQTLDPVRQAVMQDLSFNMGWATLSTFQTFLGRMSAGNYGAPPTTLAALSGHGKLARGQ